MYDGCVLRFECVCPSCKGEVPMQAQHDVIALPAQEDWKTVFTFDPADELTGMRFRCPRCGYEGDVCSVKVRFADGKSVEY